MNDSSSSITADRCVLCLDQKRSPVRIQCGHSFCYDCLDVYKSYQKHAWANRCPICRGQLKEKKRAVKRKYSTTTNATSSENATSNPTSTITSPLSDNQGDSYEQIFMLEEFMAWAAGYTNSESQDNNNAPDEEGSYVALDNTDYDDATNDITDIVDVDVPEYDDDDDDDDYYDDYYDDDYDDDFYDNGDNDQDDVVDFSTDSDDDENNYYYQFSEDVTQEYYHSTADVDESMMAQSPLQQQHQQQQQQPQQPQQQQQQHEQQFMFRDCNNNVGSASFIDPTIDWEEAIEVVIID